MKKAEKFERGWLIVNLLILMLLAGGFLFINAYVDYVNEHEVIYRLGEKNRDVEVAIEMEKCWSEAAHGYVYGMQYNVTVTNLTNTALRDWTANIRLPEGSRIDSYWNGEFVLAGNDLTVTPVVYNKVIEPNGVRDFGCVLYTNSKDNIIDFDIHFYRLLQKQEMSVFWLLVIAVGVFVVVNITALFFMAKTRRLQEQKQKYMEIVNESFLTFAGMIDAKDPYTQGHSQRVAVYARELARRMKLSEEEQQHIFYVGLLHDIGKIGVPDSILKKTGKLNSDERDMIEQHVQIGGDILKNFSAIEGIEAGARYHHERYDGTGYVSNFAGKEIPLYARIICVADAFDAMTSIRCYRPKLPMSVVISELKEYSGTQFDPDIVPYMLQMISDGVVPVVLDGTELYEELVVNKKQK